MNPLILPPEFPFEVGPWHFGGIRWEMKYQNIMVGGRLQEVHRQTSRVTNKFYLQFYSVYKNEPIRFISHLSY